MFDGIFTTTDLQRLLDELATRRSAASTARLNLYGITVDLPIKTPTVRAAWTGPGQRVELVRFDPLPRPGTVSGPAAAAYLRGLSAHPQVWVHSDDPASLVMCGRDEGRQLFMAGPDGGPVPYTRPVALPTEDLTAEFGRLLKQIPPGSRRWLSETFHYPSPRNWAAVFEQGCVIRQADNLGIWRAIRNVHPGALPGSHHPNQPWTICPTPAQIVDALREGTRSVGDYRIHAAAGLAALRARGLQAEWTGDSAGTYLIIRLAGGMDDVITAAGHDDPWPAGDGEYHHRGWSWTAETWDGTRAFTQPPGTDPEAMAADFADAVGDWIDTEYPQIVARHDPELAAAAAALADLDSATDRPESGDGDNRSEEQ
jgi:hypothetical protein